VAGGAKTFEPDYICFLGYAFFVLNYIAQWHPEAEKVDFIVERNGPITKHIQEFHSHLDVNLQAVGCASLAPLVGEMIPAGKDRIPLQAADLLCWHTARARQPKTMDAADIRRYSRLAYRKGCNYRFPKSKISKIIKGLASMPKLGE